MRRIDLIGVASGRGGHDHRSALGPAALRREGVEAWVRELGFDTTWQEIHPAAPQPEVADALEVVTDVCDRVAAAARESVLAGALPVVLGGDHSCAIGTWSGVRAALGDAGPLGLLWIDAHLDSHTPDTSHSGNYHGMPVAHLLGHGAPRLTRLDGLRGPALLARHTCLVGARSFEPEEPDFLAREGVEVYRMDAVHRHGLAGCVGAGLEIAGSGTTGFGVSIDLDALEPDEVPGTGSPVPDGIRAAELAAELAGIAARPQLLGIEIVEFNPALDVDGRTVAVVRTLLQAMLAS